MGLDGVSVTLGGGETVLGDGQHQRLLVNDRNSVLLGGDLSITQAS